MSKLWITPRWSGDYKLPPSIHDRAIDALKRLRNRNAAMKLLVFLCRFNSGPRKINRAFPIARLALSTKMRKVLDMTENEIRGALKALLKKGLIVIEPSKDGKRYQVTADGPRRLPLQYRFSSELVGVLRYIISKYRSPKGKADNSLEENSSLPCEAPPLGDLTLFDTAAARAPAIRGTPAAPARERYRAQGRALRPPKPLAPWQDENPLDEALKRWDGLVSRRMQAQAL